MSSEFDQAAAGIKEERIVIAKYDKTSTSAPEDELDPVEVIELVNGAVVRHEKRDTPCL